jgi:hypothetical protein
MRAGGCTSCSIARIRASASTSRTCALRCSSRFEHQALERAGLLEEEPFRRGQRREILKVAIAPLRARLAPRDFDRLLKALAVIYGIEAMIILKDICGAGDKETKAVVHWMMDALIDAALKRFRRDHQRMGDEAS